jgi:hypothetical protein
VKELFRSNDVVLVSYVEALLRDAGIRHVVLDANMSVMEGSLDILARRVLVEEDRAQEAEQLLAAARADRARS